MEQRYVAKLIVVRTMFRVELPISKSIANRLLVRIALRGGDLGIVPLENACEDIRLLHTILTADACQAARQGYLSDCREVGNCGTAMRFLTALYAVTAHADVLLTGNSRMRERPIGGLVDALRQIGADITYAERDGFPPLHIRGKRLQGGDVTLQQPESTQFVSALLLVSDAARDGIVVHTDCRSPYINMTERVVAQGEAVPLERDWSAAAFWYEYVALHAGKVVFFPGLTLHSLQGDCCAAAVFRWLGVATEECSGGIRIERVGKPVETLAFDFSDCPDLYPAVYMTCRRLGVQMCFSGLERLPLKESDRLQAFYQLDIAPRMPVYSACEDHRIAMALTVAGYEVDNTACIAKSYPDFLSQWRQCKNIG